MKKLAIGLMSISLLLTLIVPTTAKGKPTEPTYLTNEDRLYQFQRPGKAWTKKGPDQFNDYWFDRRDRSTIYIGSRIYMTELEEFDLSATEYAWLKAMEKKYEYSDLKVIEEGHTPIDQHPTFCSIIEFRHNRKNQKEKIYLVQGDKFYYRLRLSCPKRYFDKHLEEFEQLVKSFKLLPFKTPVLTKTPTYLTNRRKHYQFQKLEKVWGKQRAKFDDYEFLNRIDRSKIYIGSEEYTTTPEEFDLVVALNSLLGMIKERYNWTDLVVIKQNEVTITENPALHSIIECRRGAAVVKYQIYLVKGDRFYYRLMLAGYILYSDDHVEEFEQLVKSFILL